MNPPAVLMACNDAEKAAVLGTLIDDDPSLQQRAEEIARRNLATVDVSSVTDVVADALLQLDAEDLANRAGPRRHYYVEPTEAAWQLLEETLDPWIDDLRRRRRLGLQGAAVDLGNALLRALISAGEHADRTDDCLLREWAPDFPTEAAWQVKRELDAVTPTASDAAA